MCFRGNPSRIRCVRSVLSASRLLQPCRVFLMRESIKNPDCKQSCIGHVTRKAVYRRIGTKKRTTFAVRASFRHSCKTESRSLRSKSAVSQHFPHTVSYLIRPFCGHTPCELPAYRRNLALHRISCASAIPIIAQFLSDVKRISEPSHHLCGEFSARYRQHSGKCATRCTVSFCP